MLPCQVADRLDVCFGCGAQYPRSWARPTKCIQSPRRPRRLGKAHLPMDDLDMARAIIDLSAIKPLVETSQPTKVDCSNFTGVPGGHDRRRSSKQPWLSVR